MTPDMRIISRITYCVSYHVLGFTEHAIDSKFSESFFAAGLVS